VNKNKIYLEALLTNDAKIIKRLYQENFVKVKSFVLKNKGQAEDAEDIFQKALMQIAVRYEVEKFEIRSSFEAYLFTVCKNLWRKELNASKYRVTQEEFQEQAINDDDIARSALEQKRWELFTEKLLEISGRCKELLNFYFSDIPYVDIVAKFEYGSEAVARQAVYKCKERLKALIKKDKRFHLLHKP
jgi:RNA polymerase sigma factor (sigma-70 family)